MVLLEWVVLSLILISMKIIRRLLSLNRLYWLRRMLRNLHLGPRVIRKINSLNSSRLDSLSWWQVFSKTHRKSMISKLLLLARPKLLNWSTSGKIQSIIHKFSEVSFPTWSNSILRTDWHFQSFGLGWASMRWTLSQERNSWLLQCQQRLIANWLNWKSTQRAQATKNNTRLTNIQIKFRYGSGM